jgi:hypothetical protein
LAQQGARAACGVVGCSHAALLKKNAKLSTASGKYMKNWPVAFVLIALEAIK